MNLFSQLPFFGRKSAEIDGYTAEDIAAAEKAERIDFHRKFVRNGPSSFKSMTNGQARRMKNRGIESAKRKNLKRARKDYHAQHRAAATVRGHLQIIEVLPFHTGLKYDTQAQIASTSWLVQRFGVDVLLDGEPTGYKDLSRDGILMAIGEACAFYEEITGFPVRIPAGYEPAFHAVNA